MRERSWRAFSASCLSHSYVTHRSKASSETIVQLLETGDEHGILLASNESAGISSLSTRQDISKGQDKRHGHTGLSEPDRHIYPSPYRSQRCRRSRDAGHARFAIAGRTEQGNCTHEKNWICPCTAANRPCWKRSAPWPQKTRSTVH
jgi:hypothetical protein